MRETGIQENRSFNGLFSAALVVAALLFCAWFVGRSLGRIRAGDDVIHVMGSARKSITSDFIIWRGSITQSGPDVGKTYPQLKAQVEKVRGYLIGKGIKASELVPFAVNVKTLYAPVKDANGNTINQDNSAGSESGEGTYRPIMGYQLTQDIEVRSDQVDLVDSVSRQSTELISQGVAFESKPPMYLYTKLSDLKVTMQAEAARDARARAEQIANSSGAQLGTLRFARMEVPNITPLYSNQTSDNGVDDTTAKEKRITAVVVAGFTIR
ncbi:MAG: SIMPL domain-containing protein [Abitibacteriaceae bacterium]|nr:SIMPL domain-containing protein [Abditibacteriaceae bacterium]